MAIDETAPVRTLPGRTDPSIHLPFHPIQGAYVQAGRNRIHWRKGMLILEVGIWVLPFTLLLAPARRMVRLVAELQRIFLAVACRRAPPPTLGEVWSRLDRLDSATVMP
ncbi:unnamed protein product [Urochloa decumbens]|uniref:Uncharacterized protein n=1 Tax=Urochloa decumbens TaxID=240449 RepID=A0ABC9DU91_9POAL